MTFSEDGPLSRVRYRLGFSVDRSRPLGMNSVIMAPQILLLDRGPTDGALLGHQCYPRFGLSPQKIYRLCCYHASPCPETSSPKGLLVGSLRRSYCMNMRKVGRKTTRVQSR